MALDRVLAEAYGRWECMKDATLQHTDVLQIQQAKSWGKTMTTTEVAILGGGLAGLNAARLLHRAGIDFQLLEARDRLGGRILTVDETGGHGEDGGAMMACARRLTS